MGGRRNTDLVLRTQAAVHSLRYWTHGRYCQEQDIWRRISLHEGDDQNLGTTGNHNRLERVFWGLIPDRHYSIF